MQFLIVFQAEIQNTGNSWQPISQTFSAERFYFKCVASLNKKHQEKKALTIYGPEMIALKIPGGRILSRLDVICYLKVYKLYIG